MRTSLAAQMIISKTARQQEFSKRGECLKIHNFNLLPLNNGLPQKLQDFPAVVIRKDQKEKFELNLELF